MDIPEIRQALLERYPQWGDTLRAIAFTDSLQVDPTDNDGAVIYYNSRRLKFYTDEAQLFLIAQQVLHVQLAHAARGAGRDRALWRRATDAVVNAMLRGDGFQLPEDAVLLPDAAHMDAETAYVVLKAEQPPEEENEDAPGEAREAVIDVPAEPTKTAGDDTASVLRAVKDAGLADAVAGLADYLQPSEHLDFDWFPGDTIRDGMVRDVFRAYSVPHAEILLDTSYSVDEALLKAFIRACKALLKDAVIRVGCFDTKFYGFHEITRACDIDAMPFQGGGGTDFNVAVGAFTGDAENQIIFTDGYGEMPARRCDAIWVVYGTTAIAPKGGRVLYVDPFQTVYATRDERLTFAAEAAEWSSI